MAYVVGTLLIVLVCIGMPLKYIWDNDTVVMYAGIAHGWLYMILLITAFDLGRRARWSWKRLILIALAGTIPFLSFVAERSATKDVRAKLAAYPDYADQSSLPPEAARVHAHPVDSERAHGTPAMAPSKAEDSPAATVE
jgi:integral membrane protein